LADGEIVAMAVKELPLLWRTFPADRITLSEGGAVATQTWNYQESLTATGIELTAGKHYWEVELLSENVANIYIGISRPNLDPTARRTNVCFIGADYGALFGNGKLNSDQAGAYKQGDRVGMLLDLDNGSLRFFKNGVQHGPGYPVGSVTSPVLAAVQMFRVDDSVRLLPDAEAPAGV
jgi:hypothetical protein